MFSTYFLKACLIFALARKESRKLSTIAKNQWFLGSSLPLMEWYQLNHWCQWFFNGFFRQSTIGNNGFRWLPTIALWGSSNGKMEIEIFHFCWLLLTPFSNFPIVHWSNDAMVRIHCCSLPESLSPAPPCEEDEV